MSARRRVAIAGPSGSETASGADRFVRQLGAYRRRLALMTFRSYAPPIALASMAAAAVAVFVARPSAWPATLWLGGGTVAGLAIAGAIAVITIPSMQTTAAFVDRTLGLQDRVVTALQFAGAEDPVSKLVVADADRRLSRHTPSAVSTSPRPRAWWLATLASAAVLAFVLAAGRLASSPAGFGMPPSSSAADSNTTPSAKRASSPRPANTASTATGTAQPSTPAEGTPPGEKRASDRPAIATPDSASRANSPGSITSPRQDASNGRGGSAPARPAGSASEPAGAGAATTQSARASRAAGSGRGGAGAGGGSDAGTIAAASAGGVTRGVPAAGLRDAQAARLDAGGAYAIRHRNAVAAAEAAIAQGRIPASLRGYIRDYFSAIQSTGRQ